MRHLNSDQSIIHLARIYIDTNKSLKIINTLIQKKKQEEEVENKQSMRWKTKRRHNIKRKI